MTKNMMKLRDWDSCSGNVLTLATNMPSEKLRYLKRRRGTPPPFPLAELSKKLQLLGPKSLIDILRVRAFHDNVLCKTVIGTLGIRMAKENQQQAKKAIDYALDFPDFVRYTEQGHGQIVVEMKTALEDLTRTGQVELAIELGNYALCLAEKVSENFEDDWEWRCAIDQLESWLNGT